MRLKSSTARRVSLTALAALSATLVFAPSAGAVPRDAYPAGTTDWKCKPSAKHPLPVVMVHGLGATGDTNWAYIGPKLQAEGYCTYAFTYGIDPRLAALGFPGPGGTIPMEQSSKELKTFVGRVLDATGKRKVDILGHSEGTVMPRYYMERRGGAKRVKRFVAITPLWRGTDVGQLATLRDFAGQFGLSDSLVDLVAGACGSCPEFLKGSPFLKDLNSDGEAIPGVIHTNIATKYDELVSPYTSGLMKDGGTNVVVQDVCPNDLSEHVAVAFDPVVLQMVQNALDPKHSKPVTC